jgi:hypothetical protein
MHSGFFFVSSLSVVQWHLRRSFWDRFITFKYSHNKPKRITVPVPLEQPIESAPVCEVFPKIGIKGVRCAKRIPTDESDLPRSIFFKFQVWMMRVFGPSVAGLPEVDADPYARLASAYRGAKRRLYPPPILPREFSAPEPDLAALALAGPYYGYLSRLDEQRWQWDLRSLGDFEHLPGLYNLGSRVIFERTQNGALRPTLIECELGSITPADAQWPLARRIALCALTTHCGLLRHFCGVHFAFGFAGATTLRNEFRANHPVLRLLWPHIFDTQASNAMSIYGQLDPSGDYGRVYSFTVRGLYDAYDRTYPRIRLSDYDPIEYLETSGLAAAGIDSPGAANVSVFYEIFEQHANSYLSLYYRSDAELAADAAVQDWLTALNAAIPGGLPQWAKQPTVSGLARLVAVLIHISVIEHQLRGGMLWNYQAWTHVQPIRVYRDGRREPLDVYQWVVNTNLILNVNRAPLMQDFSHLALDESGAAVFRAFQRRLEGLQRELDENPRQPWKLYPDMLYANPNT